MNAKKTLLIGVLVLFGIAAYTFLFHLQVITEPVEVVDNLSESLRYSAEPVGLPDAQLLKGILKAIANLLPAS